ncbi:MAG TPA: glycosyltransferase family 4 protein [Anaerolineae bacterium]|nr:glycosyltransferase family 4 protein [Anaerolineae bacterium]
MRVLHVTPLYWPSIGGGEQVTQALAERLARDGHAVTVLTTDASSVERFWSRRGPRVNPGEPEINGVRVVRVPARPFPVGQLGLYLARGAAIRLFDPLRLSGVVRRIGAWMPRAPAFRTALARLAGQCDVIHGFNLSWESCLVDAYEIARACRRKYLMTPFLHTGEPGQGRVSRNYTMSHQLAALRGSDCVIVQTPTEARAIAALGVDETRLVEVGVGIDPAQIVGGDAVQFRTRHNLRDPIIAFIGRVTRDKGATALVRAMQQVWVSGVEADCVIAGLVLPDFDRYLKTHPVYPRLRVLGPISAADKRDLLASADVVAMPSRAESFGIVYLEAWAYGKPVIGARAGGAVDVISDGVDGYQVPFDDASALAARLLHLLSNPEHARSLGEAGRRKLFERYTWDTLYARSLDAYQSALREHG